MKWRDSCPLCALALFPIDHNKVTFAHNITAQSFASVYKVLFKRNSIFVGTVFVGAFLFQTTFDSAITKWYENHNKGKLWKDVKARIGAPEEAEDDE